MAGCCGQKCTPQVELLPQKLTIEQMKNVETFKKMMPDVIAKMGATGKYNALSTQEIVDIVTYNNIFLKQDMSEHIQSDCIQAIINMKSFYHSIKNNDIPMEEEYPAVVSSEEFFKGMEDDETGKIKMNLEDEKEDCAILTVLDIVSKNDRVCKDCGEKIPWNKKTDLCKKCEE